MSQGKKLFVVPMLLSVSADSDAALYDKVVQAQAILLKAGFGLIQDEAIEPKELNLDDDGPTSLRDVMSDLERFPAFAGRESVLRDVMSDLELVGRNPRVVIQLDDDGGAPEVRASTEIEMVVVRHGNDLRDYDTEDIFHIPDPVVANSSYPVAAGFDAADVHPSWVDRVFNTINERNGRG